MMDKLTTPPRSVMFPEELETSSPGSLEQAPASPSLPLCMTLLPIRELAGRGKVTWIWDCVSVQPTSGRYQSVGNADNQPSANVDRQASESVLILAHAAIHSAVPFVPPSACVSVVQIFLSLTTKAMNAKAIIGMKRVHCVRGYDCNIRDIMYLHNI